MSSSEQEQSGRRETYVEHDVVYAAAGASSAADLLRFPPQDSAPFEHELKLGSGAERFLAASSTLMTWGAQRSVGIEVRDISQADVERYAGVVFDESGTPELAPEAEVRYGPDGEAFLTAGTTATLSRRGGDVVRKMRVVYVVDEARSIGFALGTADDRGVVGETFYLVEHRADDTVWAIARGFYWAPSNGLFGVKARTELKQAAKEATQLLAALAPGAASKTNGDAPASDGSGSTDATDFQGE